MNKEQYVEQYSGLGGKSISRTIQLLKEGASIPFIARYRKEQTNNLDELDIEKIENLSNLYDEIDKRKTYILSVIEEKGIHDQKLINKIKEAYDLVTMF